MITTTIEKLPKICRSCQRLRCKSKFYNCKANLIFPKKPTCKRYKEHIKSRFKRFLVENWAFGLWIKNRTTRPFIKKLSNPNSVLAESFAWLPEYNYPKYNDPEYWPNLNKKWREIIKTEYPEYLPKG